MIFADQHANGNPGPIVVRKSRLGGAFSILALLSFLVLTVFLVLNWMGGGDPTYSTVPFHFGPLQGQDRTYGHLFATVDFYGFSGNCACNASNVEWNGLNLDGAALNVSCFLNFLLPGCTAVIDSGGSIQINANANIELGLCPATAVAVRYNLTLSPHYHEVNASIVQTIAAPLGGQKPVRIELDNTYVVLSDDSYLHEEGQGWALNFNKASPGSVPTFSPSVDCTRIGIHLIRGSSYLWINHGRTESLTILIAAIASYLGSVFILFTLLLGISEYVFLRHRRGRLPREVRNFQTLYEQTIKEDSKSDMAHGHAEELRAMAADQDLHAQFQKSQTHLH